MIASPIRGKGFVRMKKFKIFLLFLGVFLNFSAFAMYDDSGETPSTVSDSMDDKARKAHELAASDLIHSQEDTRALYYQNEQIIQLLRSIRDSLESIRAQQTGKNPEEKTA